MSKESVQFAEMVRVHYSLLVDLSSGQEEETPGQEDVETYEMYCELCGGMTGHRLEDAGVDELYHCCACGFVKSFRVR